MAKPTEVPEFATDDTNNVEPDAGLKATGFVAGEIIDEGQPNWLFHRIGQWLAFLNPLFTSGGGFVAPVNEHVAVSGTGRHKHGTMTMVFSAINGLPLSNDDSSDPFQNINSGLATSGGGIQTTNDGTPWTIPINLPVGKRVTAVRARVEDDSATPTTIAFQLFTWDYTGGVASVAQIGTTQTSAGDDSLQTLTISGLTHTMDAGEPLIAHFSPNNNTGVMRIFYVEVDYDDL